MSRTGLWDSHAHLDDEAFNEDREQLIAQLEQDMDGIVNPGCDAASSAVAVELAKKYPFIYAAVGWHPENLKGIPADYLQQLAEWAQHPKVVAIGEIGLDYYWKENEPKEVQKRIFLEQVDLAKQFDLPVIIHDRDAHGDMLELFQKRKYTAYRQCSTASAGRWKWRRSWLSVAITLASAVRLPIRMRRKCVRLCSIFLRSCCCLKPTALI